jgi:HEAT repeat protein
VEAVEGLESSGSAEAAPYIRLALLDDHPAVRFAGCTAVGKLRDPIATQAVRECLKDPNPNVQVAALYALHRLGDTRRTGRIPAYLLDHDEPPVRRNAALLLGLLDEPGAIKVLARAMKDEDAGVRHHALEAMARLGNAEARQELVFMTNAGVGSEEVFAIGALAGTGEPVYEDTFLYKLETASHLETKLAAARGLGLLGSDKGLRLALTALRTNRPRFNDPNDPPQGQVLRAKQLAAAALGAMGRLEALPALKYVLEQDRDPRAQVSAARAILEILAANRKEVLPFPPSKPSGR